MKLRELVEIRSGFTFRDSILVIKPGKVAVIQAGDINTARLHDATRIEFAGDKHLLQAGDVLVSARGTVLARVITPDILPAVAASSVFVLRPHSDSINPRFISRYLNSIAGQGSLLRISSGGYIKTLRKAELEDLNIPIPQPDRQELLVKLGENVDEHERLLRLKQDLVEQAYERAMKSIITETNK